MKDKTVKSVALIGACILMLLLGIDLYGRMHNLKPQVEGVSEDIPLEIEETPEMLESQVEEADLLESSESSFDFLIRKLASSDLNDELRFEAETFYELLINRVLDQDFFPGQRYRLLDLAQLHYEGEKDPFWCTDLHERIWELAKLARVLGKFEEEKIWKTHLADYYLSIHICENGIFAPDSEQAYILYKEVGDEDGMNMAVHQGVEYAMNSFIFGGSPLGSFSEDPPPLQPEVLTEITVWLSRSGLSEEEIRMEFRDMAEEIESFGYSKAATMLYTRAIDTASVK